MEEKQKSVFSIVSMFERKPHDEAPTDQVVPGEKAQIERSSPPTINTSSITTRVETEPPIVAETKATTVTKTVTKATKIIEHFERGQVPILSDENLDNLAADVETARSPELIPEDGQSLETETKREESMITVETPPTVSVKSLIQRYESEERLDMEPRDQTREFT